ncbi:rad50, putative [Ichthyophthirius multifiliis]|uniref:Rad50, putative n=1 Tax=Ichthyophthirius multifiliis TaxID=5932 RepID=G0R5H7_ICHMU|nr:rad50, putative [Ichthyophthirius multifiliis]EGR27278.1 rad50, putative [Ichthyophthirius multifiliis]|eukprot:XP_004024162.1 rad50, putative [Ichthyophthirius multifiliis]
MKQQKEKATNENSLILMKLKELEIQQIGNNENLQRLKIEEKEAEKEIKILQCGDYYMKLIQEIDEKIIQQDYSQKLIELDIKNGLCNDIDVYIDELEKTLINYHKEKMLQINKTIISTWRKIYQGNDISKIEIKAEEVGENQAGRKSFNYRIVMYIIGKNQDDLKEIDMKGRCSSGQKVLACIIIRLALAEAFTINCGILALDEPTTNLDQEHTIKLAQSLSDLIESRKGQESFQLIIISHDNNFIKLMQQNTECSEYYYVYKENGCSKITRRKYNNALMNRELD